VTPSFPSLLIGGLENAVSSFRFQAEGGVWPLKLEAWKLKPSFSPIFQAGAHAPLSCIAETS
jgi:hypothetical protein